MNAFFNELYNLFISTDEEGEHNLFYKAVSGRFSYGEALPESNKPYAIFFGLTGVPADTFTEKLNDLSFQVNIYGDGNYQEAGELLSLCKNLFDGAVVLVNGYDITIEREMETPPWRDGELWAASIEFNVIIQEA